MNGIIISSETKTIWVCNMFLKRISKIFDNKRRFKENAKIKTNKVN